MQLALIAYLSTLSMGWAEIALQPSRGDRTHAAYQRSLAGLDRPSPRTVETLKRYDLERRYRRDPDGALTILERSARQAPEPELVYALAELSWLEGRRLDRRRHTEALDRYLDAVAYAFDFLFDPDPNLAAGRQPSDPRFRLAIDLYNDGLDRLIHAALANGKMQPGDTIHLKIRGRDQALRVELRHSPWKVEEIDELLLAADFEVTGLDSHSRQYGLGVPLIGVRRAKDKDKETARAEDRFFPPETSFPLTAFLSPNSRLRDAPDAEAPRDSTLDLVDPVQFPYVGKGPGALPLEADLTTPLAYMWSRTDLGRYRWKGLLRPGDVADRAGLMLLRPYEPDKIPVVMVHGLVSSPLAWIPMLNDLLRDPWIRKRYQFLLYLYPTGVPVPIAAAGLRDALLETQRAFDTPGETPEREFQRMVLLGHSMGGLLSHAMAVDSGNALWELSSDRPFDEILGPPEVIEELKHYTFFQALPCVRRVVFLATPHRGSDYARRTVGRIGASLIAEPDRYSALLNRLIKNNPDAFDARQFRHLPTSIETLEPDAPVLQALLSMKPTLDQLSMKPTDVKFHSIIGVNRPGPVAGTTDGVVSYRSAHLDGVESERRVRSDHGVQKDPEAILEVRRILQLHIGVTPQASARVPSIEPTTSPHGEGPD